MLKRKLLSLSIAACLMFSPAAEFPRYILNDCGTVAHAQGTEHIQYSVLSDNTVEVTGYTGSESSIVIPSKLDGKYVSRIADNAFDYSETLESITIPNTVRNIGKSAFSHCYKLKRADLPDGVKSIGASAFESCISLTEAVLPDSLDTLGQSAFKNCVSVKRAVISKGIKQISDSAFESCTSLDSVTFSGNLQLIGTYAFSQCSSLKQIVLPQGVESVGEYAFYKCSKLVDVVLPETVKNIDRGAFMYCEMLSEINIPSKVTELSNYLFTGCSSLKKIIIPDTVTGIGYCAFFNCLELESIVIPQRVYSISGRAFENCISLRSAYISDGVSAISERAFKNCSKLNSIDIPDSITKISQWAFSGCSDLTAVNIGIGTELIGSYAFYNCTSLKSITIPQYVTTVGARSMGYYYGNGGMTKGDLTIKCAENSQAHKYAVENSFNTEFIRSNEITRIFGATRYETSMMVADSVRAENADQPFKNIIIASGTNYADALSASYLAAVKNAPILITSEHEPVIDSIVEYIKRNAANDCQIYIIGGEAAVSEKIVNKLSQFSVLRISGENRYSTNLEVLRAAGVYDEDILVVSGADYADALCASAVGKPILLVNNKTEKLTNEQEDLLKTLGNSEGVFPNAYIIGGTAAVNKGIEEQLGCIFSYTERVCGNNRFDTSLQVAAAFFDKSSLDSIIVAYGLNYPDGLCAGPFAFKLGRPMLLVTDNNIANAQAFVESTDVSKVIAIGGPALISDLTLKRISNAGIKT